MKLVVPELREKRSILDWAKRYVGDPDSFVARGDMIRTLLVAEGLREQHRVLELGCGALSAGVPLIWFLDESGYTGIDPNGWLVEAAVDEMELEALLQAKRVRFLWRGDFHAEGMDGEFDFVVAHSVLSHAAAWQLPQMLAAARAALKPGGKFLCSLRLGPTDSNAEAWAYPDVTFFTPRTVRVTCREYGFKPRFRPKYRARMVEVAPNDFHDWVLFERVPRHRSEYRHYTRDELEQRGLASYDIRVLLRERAGRNVTVTD